MIKEIAKNLRRNNVIDIKLFDRTYRIGLNQYDGRVTLRPICKDNDKHIGEYHGGDAHSDIDTNSENFQTRHMLFRRAVLIAKEIKNEIIRIKNENK